MSRGRKPKTVPNHSLEEIFYKSQGFYFQYILIQLGRKKGKLTNENAKDLLEEIKQKKQKLIDEKQIRQGKLQDAEIQDELLFEIPENWVWCKLDDISVNITDGTHQTPTYVESGKPFISATHVKPFRFIPKNYKFISEKAFQEYTVNRDAEIGDILVTRVGAIGEAAVIDVDLDFAFYVSVGLIKPFKEYVYPEFLTFVINSPYGNLYSKGNVSSKGSSAGNFNLGRIRSFLIPLPPRSEQKMILDFLRDFQNNELDESKEYFDSEIEGEIISLHQAQIYNNEVKNELSHQLKLVSQLRQAFLREAMKGKIVPQDEADESAELLLEKIKAEKEKLIAEKKIKRDKPLTEIKAAEIPFEIPQNWTWCNLGNIVESMNNGLYKPEQFYKPNGIACLRMYNIQAGQISLHNLKRMILTDSEIETYSLKKGDLLLNRVNSIELLGKAAYIGDLNEILVYESKNIRVRFIEKNVMPQFMNIIFLTDIIKNQILQNFKKVTGQASINQVQLSSFIIPIPPLAEQKRIVEKLERLIKFCDELEMNIRESKLQAESLLQTALKEALKPKEELKLTA